MTDDPVRAQYEAYPYPAREPTDENKRLITGSPSHILELNHYVFGGRRDFRQPLRVLVAGGGTGDGLIMLAQQLADARCPAEITYMDLSAASLDIARERAHARGLDRIRFENRSLLDLESPDQGGGQGGDQEGDMGPFDYIDCCGVLHHLESPQRGLAALTRVLAPDGGMGLMVYGELGRTGVYPMQEMLRTLTVDDAAGEKVAMARRLMKHLPPTNWLNRNPWLGDHLEGGDAGLYDLFLHDRDRAYRVADIATLVDSAGLALTALVEPARYDPASYINDARLLERLAALDWVERAAFAELVAGNMRKHVFYVVRKDRLEQAVARPPSPPYSRGAVPCLRDMDGEKMAAKMKPGAAMTATLDGVAFRFAMPPLAQAMVARMDAKRTLGDIHAQLADLDGRLEAADFHKQFLQLYAALNGLGRLFLSFPPAETSEMNE